MYVSPNFKNKRAMLEALAAGRDVRVFSPGPFPCPENGGTALEGPHYPAPHTWYASVTLEAGRIVRVDGKSVERIRAAVAARLKCGPTAADVAAALAARPARKSRGALAGKE